MNTPQELPKPTDAELSILRVLWQRGASTVREVHEELNQQKPTGYTTVLKLLQIMTEKGLVLRNEEERAHIYQATQAQEIAQSRLMGDLVDQLFDGSAQKLVLHALSNHKATPAEMAEIRHLLEAMEKEEER
jgi:predicted transcriptional regulator